MPGNEARPGAEPDGDPDAGIDPDGAVPEHADGAVPEHAERRVSKHAEGDVPEHDDWYRWGRVILYAEMALAVLVTAFSLYLAFSGRAGFLT